MIRRTSKGDAWFTIMRWDNTSTDTVELDTMGVDWHVLDGDLCLRYVDDSGSTMVSHTLLIEVGESVSFTPLGWVAYREEHEGNFERFVP
jgi:hypothetical protein